MNYSVNLQRASHVLGMGQLWEHVSCLAQRRSLQALKETSSGELMGSSSCAICSAPLHAALPHTESRVLRVN